MENIEFKMKVGLSSEDKNNIKNSIKSEVLNSVAGGSPKGVYANLAALKTKFPIGTDGVYLIKDNSTWCFWNGTSWEEGGTYLSSDNFFSNYVEKVEGKDLSTNDFTNEARTYLYTLVGQMGDIYTPKKMWFAEPKINDNGEIYTIDQESITANVIGLLNTSYTITKSNQAFVNYLVGATNINKADISDIKSTLTSDKARYINYTETKDDYSTIGTSAYYNGNLLGMIENAFGLAKSNESLARVNKGKILAHEEMYGKTNQANIQRLYGGELPSNPAKGQLIVSIDSENNETYKQYDGEGWVEVDFEQNTRNIDRLLNLKDKYLFKGCSESVIIPWTVDDFDKYTLKLILSSMSYEPYSTNDIYELIPAQMDYLKQNGKITTYLDLKTYGNCGLNHIAISVEWNNTTNILTIIKNETGTCFTVYFNFSNSTVSTTGSSYASLSIMQVKAIPRGE